MRLVNEHSNVKQNVPPTVTNGSLTGSDVTGIVEFTSTGHAGPQTTVNFRFPHKNPPNVLLTPQNMNSGVNNMGYYVTSTEMTFTINAAFTCGPSVQKFSYLVFHNE